MFYSIESPLLKKEKSSNSVHRLTSQLNKIKKKKENNEEEMFHSQSSGRSSDVESSRKDQFIL